MLKKTISYVDYNGNERTEDFYFNLSEAECVELECSVVGGITEAINKLISLQDIPSIVKIAKEWVLKAYGEKSPDGKRFIKSEELSTAFSQTEAYSQLFMEIATNSESAAEFFNGIIPHKIEKKEIVSKVS